METTSKKSTLKRTTWAIRVLTALVILLFAMSGIMKLAHGPDVVQGFTRIGIPEAAILPLGLLELSCLAIYLIPRTAVLGTLLLTGYLGGAVLANIASRGDFIHVLVVGLLVWAGAWLRVPELRSLIPIRYQATDADAQAELPAASELA
ncbi:MAG TPA: DoxX family protein [Bryobacteraceae bacterium]|nr:DoxX family protein [Bryobacteraceae bacterium]